MRARLEEYAGDRWCSRAVKAQDEITKGGKKSESTSREAHGEVAAAVWVRGDSSLDRRRGRGKLSSGCILKTEPTVDQLWAVKERNGQGPQENRIEP